MATTTRYVNTNSTAGGDGTTNATTGANRAYATLAEAESALQGSYSDLVEIICSGTTADNYASIDGWTLSGSGRIEIKGASTSSGKWDTSKYRIESTDSNALYINEAPIKLLDLQVAMKTDTDSAKYCIYIYSGISSGQAVYVERCVIKNITATTGIRSGIYWYTSDGTYYIGNNVIYDMVGNNSSSGMRISDSVTAYVYHNTICNCRYGVHAPNSPANVRFKNNLLQDNTYSVYNNSGSSFNAASNYNVCDDNGTSDYLVPGANSVKSTEINFTDEGADDFHTNDANAQVANCLYSDASYAITTDIDGAARPSSGSVFAGADEGSAGTSASHSASTLTSTGTLHAPSVTLSPTVSPNLLTTTASLESPTVTASAILEPSTLIATSDLIFPTVAISYSYDASVLTATSSLGSPTENISYTHEPSTLTSTITIHEPIVAEAITYDGSVLTAISSIGTPSYSSNVTLTVSTFTATASLSTASVAIASSVSPSTLTATASLGASGVGSEEGIIDLLSLIIGGIATDSISTVTAIASVSAPTISILNDFTGFNATTLTATVRWNPLKPQLSPPLMFNPNLNTDYSNLPQRLRELSILVDEISRRLNRLE